MHVSLSIYVGIMFFFLIVYDFDHMLIDWFVTISYKPVRKKILLLRSFNAERVLLLASCF
jgi:hypothetical protein